MLGANRPGVGLERVVVGKPAVHSNRRRSIKPGEKRQFLQMVFKAVDFDVMLRQVFNKLLVSEGANLDSSRRQAQ
jgi:hypothetical protein